MSRALLVSRASDDQARTFGRGTASSSGIDMEHGVIRTDDTFVRRDGTTFPVSYLLSPFSSASKDIGWVVVFSDSTGAADRELALGLTVKPRRYTDHRTLPISRHGWWIDWVPRTVSTRSNEHAVRHCA